MEGKKINWLRFGLCSGTLCLVAVLLFGLYKGGALEIISKLSGDGKSPNLVWLAENIFVVVPVWILVVISEIFYYNKEKYVPIYTQIEKLMVFSISAFFTFFVLLPVVKISGENMNELLEGEAIKTLWDSTYMWFFSQIIPYMIIIVYHIARSSTEKRELYAPEEATDGDRDEEEFCEDEEDDSNV